ncbi:RNA methyltransferase [bacterium]|nr:RNA methyltransferase [bacterium]
MLNKNRLKEIKKLTQKKFRNTSSEILVEGKRIIEQIITNGYYPEIVFINESNIEVKSIIAKEKRNIIEYVSPQVIEQLTETKSPQDIVALFKKPKLCFPTKGNFLYLDALRDPGNMGTIFRTAASFNIDGIFISEDSCDVFSPKVIRSSLGAIYTVPFKIIELTKINLPDCDIFSTELNGLPITEITQFKQNMIIVVGNEANGVSEQNSKLATQKITIPISPQMESLNASVATSICLFNLLWNKYGNKFLNRP